MNKTLSIATLHDCLPEEIHRNSSGWFLIEAFREIGFEVTSKSTGDFFISFEHNEKKLQEFKRSSKSPKNCVLIRVETDSVYPTQYKSNLNHLYTLIFSPGSVNEVQKRLKPLKHPYLYQTTPVKPKEHDPTSNQVLERNLKDGIFEFTNWLARPIKLSLVAANKVSSQEDNNYQLRRNMVRLLGPSILSTYGPLWESSDFKKIRHRLGVLKFALKTRSQIDFRQIYGNLNWRYLNTQGVVKDKHETLRNSQFSLVIENSQRAITEKLLDCFINGSIPIYYGPDISQFDLDEEMIYRFDGDFQQIVEIVNGIEPEEIREKLEKIRGIVTEPSFFRDWSAESVMRLIFEEIVTHFNFQKASM